MKCAEFIPSLFSDLQTQPCILSWLQKDIPTERRPSVLIDMAITGITDCINLNGWLRECAEHGWRMRRCACLFCVWCPRAADLRRGHALPPTRLCLCLHECACRNLVFCVAPPNSPTELGTTNIVINATLHGRQRLSANNHTPPVNRFLGIFFSFFG